MTKEQYIKVTDYMRKDPERTKRINSLNHILTSLVFLVYPLFLFMLFIEHNPWLARAIIVPLDSFLILTFVRGFINAPRPYEKFGVPPVITKDTKGKSFPSRHVFSVFVIAITVFYMHPGAGVMLCLIGVLIAIVRVMGGVHEPRDVIAGALAGIISGLIGYYLI